MFAESVRCRGRRIRVHLQIGNNETKIPVPNIIFVTLLVHLKALAAYQSVVHCGIPQAIMPYFLRG